MKKSRKKSKIERKKVYDITLVAIVIIAILVLVFTLKSMPKKEASQPVASVNGIEITQQDLVEIMITVPQQLRENLTQDLVIEQAINLEIIQQEAKKLGLEVTDEEVESSMNKILESYGMPREDFELLLKDQGVDESTLKSAYKKQLLALKFVNETILKNIEVSEDEIMQTYDVYSDQLNSSYEDSREDVKKALLVQKGQIILEQYLQQKRDEYEIVRY